MNMEFLGNLGELIGGLAVIISFIFLGLQIRQNTKALRAQSARESEVDMANLNREMAVNGEMAELLIQFVEEDADFNKFTKAERFRYQMHTRAVLQMLQADYYLNLEGSLPDYVWHRRLKWFRSFIDLPVPKPLFEEEVAQEGFDKGFLAALRAEKVSINVRWAETGGD